MHEGVIFFVFQVKLIIMVLNPMYTNNFTSEISVDLFHFLRASEWNAALQRLKQVADIVTTAFKVLTL
jgi:hypothetical protein